MKGTYRFLLVALWAVVFLPALYFLTTPLYAYAAFGTSPPFLNADHLVKGAHYVQTVYLVQDRPDVDVPINAVLEIPESIRSWVTLDRGFSFTIPKGVQQFPVQVSVQIPQDAGLGAYHGNLTFTTAPTQSGQVTIALGAQVVINLTVGEGIYRNIHIPLIRFLDIEEGWNPRVQVKFANDGNVPEAFTGATYELLDQFGATRLAYLQKSEGFPEIPPFTIKEDIIEFPSSFRLGIGQYWGSVNFYQNDTLIGSQKTVFNVLKQGSLSGTWDQLALILKNNSIVAGGGFLAAILILFWFARMMRRKRRSS